MCNTTLAVFLSFPEGRELAAGLIAEGCAAMEKAGMPMASLPVMDPRELAARLEKKPGSFERDTRPTGSRLQQPPAGLPAEGKPTEAAQLNRRIVEIASDAGLHLTWNWRILQKMSRVSGLGFYRTPGGPPALAGHRRRPWIELARKTGRGLGSACRAHARARRATAVILGSGLGDFAARVKGDEMPFPALPGFPVPTVQGTLGSIHRRRQRRRHGGPRSTTTRATPSRTWSCRSSSCTAWACAR